ncbi:hypothetical protein VPH35_044993 [Triticum aestivum]
MDSDISSCSHDRASELGANTPVSSTSSLKDTSCPMGIDERVTEPSKHPLSTKASDWQDSDGDGEAKDSNEPGFIGCTIADSPQSSCSSGIICRTGATTSVMTTPPWTDDVPSTAQGENSPKKHSSTSSVEPDWSSGTKGTTEAT